MGFGTYFGIKILRGTGTYQGRWLNRQKWGHGETVFTDDDNYLFAQQCFVLFIIRESGTTKLEDWLKIRIQRNDG